MACGCQKNKGAALKWGVDFSGTSYRFEDGTASKKVYGTVAEANAAIKKAGASGRVQPKPAA